MLAVERNLELAAKSLLGLYNELLALVSVANVNVAVDASTVLVLPRVWIQAAAFAEFGRHTGWYRGALTLGACSHRPADKDRTLCKAIAGVLRDWGQQTDLVTQLNNTASAKAVLTALQVKDIELDEASYDFDDETTRLNQIIVPVSVICRASTT